MQHWIIEPYDPLIVRDGRPFGPHPGARARTLPFPFPSTIAGGLRTRAGEDGNGIFDPDQIPRVKGITVRGPLLVELDPSGNAEAMLPAPRDALFLQDNETREVTRHRLQPLQVPAGADGDLPPDLAYPVGLARPDLRKPFKDAPDYWHWSRFEEWLFKPPVLKALDSKEMAGLGHAGPGADRRVHVALDPQTFSGIDGGLFATGGLSFVRESKAESLHSVRRLALAVSADNLDGLAIEEGFAPLGGERRIMSWQKSADIFPKTPGKVIEEIVKTGFCRLILLTPAVFDQGWQPGWLLQPRHGLQPRLKAALTGKPQTISGWDFEQKGPKKTRRLVPAGSVYFLELGGQESSRREWAEAVSMQNISDEEVDRKSGFGLAILGTWSGQAVEIAEEVTKDA